MKWDLRLSKSVYWLRFDDIGTQFSVVSIKFCIFQLLIQLRGQIIISQTFSDSAFSSFQGFLSYQFMQPAFFSSHKPFDDVYLMYNVQNVLFRLEQNPCSSSPCVKNATCRPNFLGDNSYRCVCPIGFTGEMCSKGIYQKEMIVTLKCAQFETIEIKQEFFRGFDGISTLELHVASAMPFPSYSKNPQVLT